MKGALVKAGLTTACAVACTAVGPSAAFAVTVDFNYTGETQQWVVPEGVTSATFDLHGAAGGAAQPGLEGPCQGGWGAHVQATLPVTPGQVVQIEVGDKGSSQLEGGTGYNGGGAPGASWSGGGGGASDVRTSAELADRLLVAGGGGGCGYDSFGGGHSGGAGSDGRDVLATTTHSSPL